MKKRDKWLPADSLSKYNLICLNAPPLVRCAKRPRPTLNNGRRGWITAATLNDPVNSKTEVSS